MSKIRTISSESDLKKEVSRNFQYNLEIDQKSFYFEEGADKYINKISPEVKNKYIHLITDLGEEILNDFFKKKEKVSFISLGCGESKVEKTFLENSQNNGFDINYFGVDSSMAMIEKAIFNVSKLNFNSQFIYADFSSEKFKSEFKQIINLNNKKIFAFFGGTIGNVPQHYIANTLRSILNKGDILWIGTQCLNKIDHNISNIYFKKYLNWLKKDKESKDFLEYPLKKNNIPIKNGKIILEMSKDASINTLIFRYGFLVEKKIEIKNQDENFTLLEGDLVNLLTIRVYELDSLINFFENRDFKLITYKTQDETLQIAFEKQ